MFIITYRKYFFIISGLIVGLSILAISLFGFNLGIDFTGGTIIEVAYPQGRPNIEDVRSLVDGLGTSAAGIDVGAYSLRPAGENKYSIATRNLAPNEQEAVISALSLDGAAEIQIDRVNSIGPVIGSQLKQKSLIAIVVVILAIVSFVSFVFRHVSRPVASWKYGIVAILALVHDVIVPAGIYVLYSHFTGAQIDLLFVTAILALLGYSVSDTIVVFDRIRENLRHTAKEDFETVVGRSLSQTFVRSLNTSLMVIFMLLALFIVGSPSTHDFIFVLLVGTVAGTYSSLFLAAPVLVALEKLQGSRK